MILVTGGTGFLGRHVVNALLQTQQRLRLLVRRRDHPSLAEWSQAIAAGQLELAEGNLNEAGTLGDAFAGAERVVHAAGLVSFAARDRVRLLSTNAEGTGRVVDFALEAGVKQLVYVSSIAALGRPARKAGEEVELITEATAFAKAGATVYGHSKHLGERHVLRGVEEGLSAVIANPGVIVGPALNWADSSAAVVKLAAGALGRFYPQGGNGFVGVSDVARGIVRMTLGPSRMGQRYILVSENLTHKELLTYLRRAMGKSLPSTQVPPELALPAGWLIEQAANAMGKSSAVTYETMRTASQVWRYDNRRFREGYEFVFTPMQSVITDTVAAYRAFTQH